MSNAQAAGRDLNKWLFAYMGRRGAQELFDSLFSAPGQPMHSHPAGFTHLHLYLDADDYDDGQDDMFAISLSQFHGAHNLQELRITVGGDIVFTRNNYIMIAPTTATRPEKPYANDAGDTVRWPAVFPTYKALLRGTISQERMAKLPVKIHCQERAIVSALLGIRGVPCVRIDGPMDVGLKEELLSTMSVADMANSPPPLTTASTATSPSAPILPITPPRAAKHQELLLSSLGSSSLSSPPASSLLTTPPPSPNINEPPPVRGYKPLHDEHLGFVGWWITDARLAKRQKTSHDSSDKAADNSASTASKGKRNSPRNGRNARNARNARCARSISPQLDKRADSISPPRLTEWDWRGRNLSEPILPLNVPEQERRVEDMVRISATRQSEGDHAYVYPDWILPTGPGARILLGWRVDGGQEERGVRKNEDAKWKAGRGDLTPWWE